MRSFDRAQASTLLIMVAIAYAMKHWYSHATIYDVQWLLIPLTQLLELCLPGNFEATGTGEWFHAGWQILLVKSCSGMNFFLMSFVCYTVVLDVYLQKYTRATLVHAGHCVCFALLLAWLTTLFVNCLRVLLAMSLIRHPEWLQWTGLSAETIHRIAGLVIYIPILYVQMSLSNRLTRWHAYILSAVLILATLVVIPLITGNAFDAYDRFARHTLVVIFALLCFGLLLFTASKLRPSLMRWIRYVYHKGKMLALSFSLGTD